MGGRHGAEGDVGDAAAGLGSDQSREPRKPPSWCLRARALGWPQESQELGKQQVAVGTPRGSDQHPDPLFPGLICWLLWLFRAPLFSQAAVLRGVTQRSCSLTSPMLRPQGDRVFTNSNKETRASLGA